MKSSVLKMSRIFRNKGAFIDEAKRLFENYDPEPVKNFIERNYNIKPDKVGALGWGHGNMFFYVQEGKKRYTARIARPREDLKKNIVFESKISKLLAKNGIPVKIPITTKKGKDFIEFEDGPIFQLQNYLEGFIPHPIRDFHIEMAGKFLRRLHEVSEGFHLEFPSNVVKENTLNLKPLIKNIEESISLINPRWRFRYHKSRISEFPRSSIDFIKTFKKVTLKHRSFLKKDFLHGDFNAGNIVFVNDKVSGVYDFEHAAFGPNTYDLGYALAHYSFGFYRDRTREVMNFFMKGYGEIQDKEILEPCIKISILKRAVDVIRHKEKYPEREFWEGELENYTDRFLRFKLWF